MLRRGSGARSFRVAVHCGQTEKIPRKLANAPVKFHDAVATNFVTKTKIPPSCSHEPHEIHRRLRLSHTLPPHDTPICVRSPIAVCVHSSGTQTCGIPQESGGCKSLGDWRAEQEAVDTPSEPSGQENDDAENQG